LFLQVGDRFADPGPGAESTCFLAPPKTLQIGTTYLVGIGGPCSSISAWSALNNISDDITQSLANGCIDCPATGVYFPKQSHNISENGGEVLVELALTNVVSVDLSIQVESMDLFVRIRDNNTGRGVDYTPGPYNITFSAGHTAAIFAISISNDDVGEETETFGLAIVKDSLPNCTFLRDFTFGPEATVDIIDDDHDCKCLDTRWDS